MSLLRRLGISVSIASLAVACGGASMTPTAPTPVTSVSAVVPNAPAGDIRLAAVTHPSGSTLLVQNCGPAFTGIAGDHLCNMDWHAAFDVTSAADLSNTVMTVSFEGASGRCGLVYAVSQNFGANQPRLVGTSERLYLTYEPEGYDNLEVEQFCQLPATTTRLVVQVWDPARPATPLMTQTFDYVSMFVSR